MVARDVPGEREAELERLRGEHRRADTALEELERQRSHSPEEHLEIARLKKLKLKIKDAIRRLEASR